MKNKSYLLLLTLSLLATACDRVSDIDSKYEKKSQIPINAHSITVVQDFNAYSKTAESDQLFSKTLVQGIEKWAKVRLLPVSQDGVAQITVREASITKIPDAGNGEALDGKLNVMINFLDKNGALLSYAEAKVATHKYAPSNMSDGEHKTIMHALITQLINALDKEIEEAIFSRFNANKDTGHVIK